MLLDLTPPNHKRSKIPGYLSAEGSRCLSGIVLATHIDVSNIERVVDLAKLWGGGISVAVYIGEPGLEIDAEHKILRVFQRLCLLNIRISLHILFGVRFNNYQDNLEYHPYDLLYPVNALRNLALTGIADPQRLVMAMDHDFSPSIELISSVCRVADIILAPEARPTLFAVPEFELDSDLGDSSISRRELHDLCLNGKAFPYQSILKRKPKHVDWNDWCSGHAVNPPPHLRLDKGLQGLDFPRWFSVPFSRLETYEAISLREADFLFIGKLSIFPGLFSCT